MRDAYATAFKLVTLGFSVIPSGGGDKHKAPLVNWRDYQTTAPDESQLEAWERELNPALWGIVTNDRIAVIDADTPETRVALEAEIGEPHVTTPRGGAHWYVDTAGHPMKTVARLLPGIDVRGVGGFVNIAGGKYQIKRLPVPGDNLIPWAKLPERILAALNGSKPVPKAKQSAPIGEGQRNDHLTRIAGAMRRNGAGQGAIEAALIEMNARQCQPPLSEREVLAIAGSVSRYEPKPDTEQPAHFNLTDAGNAEYFTALYADKLRYDHRRARWLEWHKHYWREDNDGQVMRLALKANRDRYRDTISIEDLKERQRVAKWVIGSEQRARLESTIAIAKNLLPIADSGERWDTDPWSFCTANGVLELKTGHLSPGKPEDMITLRSPVVYDDEAKAPRWLQFLDEIFSGDTDLIEWLHRYLGYCLTGDTREQTVAIPYGKGANGKTKLLSILRHVMGDYAYDAPFSTFELTQRAAIPNDLAALVGKRLVTSSETNEGTRLNEARIKALSGQDSITARFLHAEFFTFEPVAKFFLAVNHRPRVQDDSYGFWRRVRLIPFNREFKGEADDKLLLDKLIAESSGILNWLIEGCLKWQQHGLEPTPDCVLRATEEYQTDSDPLSQFILDECAFTAQARVKASDLYKAYLKWCDDQGMRERERMTNNAFGRRMGQQFKKVHDRDGTFYQGVGLKCDGFVTDYEPNGNFCNVFPNINTRVRNKSEKPSQSITTLDNPSQDFAELPDCPVCGRNEWAYSLDSDLLCPCGKSLKGGEQC